MEDEKVETSNLDEIMKDSTLTNPELTFCEKTTYLDFLLSNASTDEEKEEIKKTINDFLEISKDQDEVDEDSVEDEDNEEEENEVEIELVKEDEEDIDEEEEK